ncbi:MAG: glycoside hydrolase family 2 protein [Candidatus Fimimonas sp.]
MSFCNLTTPWSKSVGDKPLQEYPRPQFRRKSYLNLNGWWNYAITKNSQKPNSFDGEILVPFSPESALSGVGKQLKPNEYLWYFKDFSLPNGFNKGVVLLHFGAVDSICDVFVNDKHVCSHQGGYNAFTADISDALRPNGENRLVLRVQDFTDTKYFTNGKQSSHRKGMWYTPQSGIWQTVWLESVCKQHVKGLKITPDFDNAQVVVEVDCNFDEPVTVIVTDGDKEICKADGKKTFTLAFPDGNFCEWTPETPFLYGLKVVSRRDFVESYFAMRKFSCEKVDGVWRLMLNNKPYFHNGLLDQGYWPDGLYTAPSDEAMIFDIQTMKDLGFNMLRKHIKVEPMRWYYHCDRLGMLVWQDMPSGGTRQHKLVTLGLPFLGKTNVKDSNYKLFSRKSKQSRDVFEREYREMIAQLYNCPCISTWVPFNEGWGQFDANRVAQLTKALDPTRLVDHASGWHDQGGGDFQSLHVYFKKVKLHCDGKRATVLSEFGGYSYKDVQHSFNLKNTYAYKLFDAKEQFNDGLKRLFERDVIPQIAKGLSATVYTQVSDVEDEVNGLLTYDRQVLKVDAEMMKEINARVKI